MKCRCVDIKFVYSHRFSVSRAECLTCSTKDVIGALHAPNYSHDEAPFAMRAQVILQRIANAEGPLEIRIL